MTLLHGLKRVAIAAGLSLTAFAASSSLLAAADFGDITFHLSWAKNVQAAGAYLAEETGAFKEAGFNSVELVAGGTAGIPATTALATGKAWIGVSDPLSVASANAEGGDFRIVASLYQRSPYTIVSLKDNPINKPEDLIGKTIAVSNTSEGVWNAFLAINNLDPSQITRVPFSNDITIITTGGADAYLGFTVGGATLRSRGVEAQEFYLSEFGLEYVGEALIAPKATIEGERDKLKAFLTAWVKGWKAALADPDEATRITVEKYGKEQNYKFEEQLLYFDIQSRFIETDETKENGIGTLTPRAQEANIAFLKLAGTETTADALFDLSVLDEVYADNPDLK